MDVNCLVERTGTLREPTQPIPLQQPLVWHNAQAHAFRYHVVNDDGSAADMTGIGVTGNFTVDGYDTISPISGTITGNTAQILLPAACYAYPGRYTFEMNLTKGSQTRTVMWVEGRVSKHQTAAIVDPGTPVTNIETAIGNANAAAASATNAASAANSAAASANAAASHSVRYDEAQSLTSAQKGQALTNIGLDTDTKTKIDSANTQISSINTQISGININLNDERSKIRKIAVFGSLTSNLCDPDVVTTGCIAEDGTISTAGTYANYETSGYIDVTPNTTYGIACFNKSDNSRTNDRKCCLFFDKNGAPITSSYVNQTGSGYTVTSPNNAAYIRVGVHNSLKVNIQRNAIPVSYVAYQSTASLDPSIGMNEVMTDAISAEISHIGTFLPNSENLLNPETTTAGFLMSDGSLALDGAYSQYATSDYIPVDASESYTISTWDDNGQTTERKVCLCYDSNKQLVSDSYTNSTNRPVTIQTTGTTRYIRVSYPASDAAAKVVKGSSAGSWVPYSEKGFFNEAFGLNETMEAEIDEKIATIGTLGPGSINLFNPNATVVGFIMDDGSVATNGAYANYVTSSLIPVDASTRYTLSTFRKSDGNSSGGRKACLLYDANGSLISGTYSNRTIVEFDVNTTAETVYARISVANDENGCFAKRSSATPYVPYSEKGFFNEAFGLNETMEAEVREIASVGSAFIGKKILNIGDSISEDRPEARSYSYQFAQVTGAVLTTDYGLSGSTLSLTSDQADRGCIYSQALKAVTDHPNEAYDIILIDGGTNDNNQNRTLGSITGTIGQYSLSDYTATFDETTILGALEAIFQTLRNQYTGAVIVFVLPHKNEHTGADWKAIIDGIRNVCEKWSIPILDIYSEGELNVRITAMRTDYTDAGGTHPNTLGIQRFYLPKLIDLLKGYFY